MRLAKNRRRCGLCKGEVVDWYYNEKLDLCADCIAVAKAIGQ